jgi:tetratricopeptide (TPR) repeat protein
MIVRDAAQELTACIESVRGVVDDIAIADTGSVDNTIELARSLGARVISIPWEKDFSRARNLALCEVHTDWVLSIDADERLDPAAARRLPALLANPRAAGYQVTIRNYVLSLADRIWDRLAKPNDSPFAVAKQFPAYIDHENVRLFRREPGLYFTGRVHETVGQRIHETGGKLGRADFLIHHFGLAVDASAQNRKNQFYRELGLEKVREMPENAQAHLELGMVEVEAAEALRRFERACELKPDFAEAWIFAGLAHGRLGHSELSLARLRKAAALVPKNPLVAQSLGDVYYDLGNFPEAEKSYRQAQKHGARHISLHSKLGLAQIRNRRTTSGLKRLRESIADAPGIAELHDRLIVACVWLNRVQEAAAAAETKLCHVDPTEKDYLRAASIHAQLRHWARAAELSKQGLSRFPDSERLRAILAEITSEISHASIEPVLR